MSIAPHSIFYRDKKEISENNLVDTMINDGLVDAFNNYHMGVTAENVAEKYNISRQEQDIFSISSQKKAKKAIFMQFLTTICCVRTQYAVKITLRGPKLWAV